MHFKVGDEVRIRSWDDMRQEFGLASRGEIKTPDDFIFSARMKNFCGYFGVIAYIDTDGEVFFEGDCLFSCDGEQIDASVCFSQYMLEPSERIRPFS